MKDVAGRYQDRAARVYRHAREERYRQLASTLDKVTAPRRVRDSTCCAPVWLPARVQRRIPLSRRCRWVPAEYTMLAEGPASGARSRRPLPRRVLVSAGEGRRPQARVVPPHPDLVRGPCP